MKSWRPLDMEVWLLLALSKSNDGMAGHRRAGAAVEHARCFALTVFATYSNRGELFWTEGGKCRVTQILIRYFLCNRCGLLTRSSQYLAPSSQTQYSNYYPYSVPKVTSLNTVIKQAYDF